MFKILNFVYAILRHVFNEIVYLEQLSNKNEYF